MRIEDFESFVDFFVSEQGDLNAKNSHGETVFDIISRHRYGKPYLQILNKYKNKS